MSESESVSPRLRTRILQLQFHVSMDAADIAVLVSTKDAIDDT